MFFEVSTPSEVRCLERGSCYRVNCQNNEVVLTLSVHHQTLLSLCQLLPLHGQLALVGQCPVKEFSS